MSENTLPSPARRGPFRLSISLFLTLCSGAVLLLFLWISQEGLDNIDDISRLATSIEQESLPELLQNQRTFIHIESLRRNAEVVYAAEDPSLRRNARINAQAMAAESVFDRDPDFYAAVQRASSMITALARLKDKAQTSRNELFTRALELSDLLMELRPDAGDVERPLLDTLAGQREMFIDAKTGAPPPPPPDQRTAVEALCRRLAGASPAGTAHCNRLKALSADYAADWESYRKMRADAEELWHEVDTAIRELRDRIGAGAEAAGAASLTAIKASALTAHARTRFIFTCGIFALGLYLLVLHKAIVKPLRWTAKKLEEIQQGDLHVEMPDIRIRELAEVAGLLDRFSTHLSELYRHTSQLEEDSAGKRDLEEIMRAVFQASPDGYVIWNEDGIISAGPGFLALLGVRDIDEIRARQAELGFLGEERRRQEYRLVLERGVVRMEHTYRDVHGEPIPCEVTRLRLELRGKPVLLSYVRDMRTQKQAEESLRRAKEQAESAGRAKSDFLARMSHEIRTPMNGVLGLTHLALAQSPPPEQRQYLTKIEASAKILLGVINDILDFSKIESGQMRLEPTPFVLDDLLTTLRDLFQPQAEAKGLEFVLERDPAVPAMLTGDSLRLSQVLLNLCGNAFKFTEKGRVILSIAPAADNSEAFPVHFAVTDTGVGMTAGQLAGLFRPFVQADVSTTRKYGGTGLGLVISKLLVEMMGGTLEVESTPGAGSRFSFTLPLSRTTEAGMQTGPADEVDTSVLIGRRVLLAEDNEINREIAMALLDGLGVQALTAVNGREALDILEKEDVDGILMDIQMPEMDGLTATRLLRAHGRPGVRNLPVIAMTAHAMQEDRDKSLAAGMDDHVTKPIDLQDLTRKLVRLLGNGNRPSDDTPLGTGSGYSIGGAASNRE